MRTQNNIAPARLPRRAIALAVMSVFAGGVQAQQAGSTDKIEVIGTTPVPGIGVPKDQIPSNVQTANDKKFEQSQSVNLPDFLTTQIPSVNVNEIQGNPYQMDVNYRGFTASPLLGTPQGLSVYVDGVRVNEPFGDIVNWDLIPKAALSSITLMPGSNPLFGLNTLGGALSLTTKSGDTHPGTEIEVSGGSFGRSNVEVSHGQRFGDDWHAFVSASSFDESGWRDDSPSHVRQAFAKVGQRNAQFDWDLSLNYAGTDMVGNGLIPEDMYGKRREAIYTKPDQTRNELYQTTFNGGVWLDDKQRISATAYQRTLRTRTLNGDLNDDYDPLGGVTETGVENRTRTNQYGGGIALQWSLTTDRNQLAVGTTYDRAHSRFEQSSAEGSLTPDRGVSPEEEAEVENELTGRTSTNSLYITDTLSLADNLQLTLSGRYNRTRVKTIDELNPTPPNLDGNFTYNKFNPAIGVTWQTTPALTLYGGFSQGNRAPSPIELGCADPANPCTLPNALQSDPFLKQVVARTIELGARGRIADALHWNAGVFRTNNSDDILFVGTSAGASQGYFTNFGHTRRQGAELGLSGNVGPVDWNASYSYIKATFESSACLLSPANITAGSGGCAEDEIRVSPGNRIPGIPDHSLKLDASVRATDKLRIGGSMVAYSDQYVRGNENNKHRPGINADGEEVDGSGKIGGYAIFNLRADYAIGGGWEVFARINNVFDKRYASAGQLGETAFDANGNLTADFLSTGEDRAVQFIAPGAPRAGWIGVRYRFGGSAS